MTINVRNSCNKCSINVLCLSEGAIVICSRHFHSKADRDVSLNCVPAVIAAIFLCYLCGVAMMVMMVTRMHSKASCKDPNATGTICCVPLKLRSHHITKRYWAYLNLASKLNLTWYLRCTSSAPCVPTRYKLLTSALGPIGEDNSIAAKSS